MVTVHLATAMICIAEACFPALIGKSTPVGEFQMIQRLTDDPGYSGDVIQFAEDDKQVYAIHRLYLLNPKQHRDQRIKSNKVSDRIITDGCVNVTPDVYDKLVSCCSNDKLIIK